jgi:hypothetical protein
MITSTISSAGSSLSLRRSSMSCDSGPANANWRSPRKYVDDHVVYYVHKCLWLVHSRGWFGGATMLHPKRAPRTPGGYCAKHAPGTSFHGDFGNAIRWSAGFELAAALHIKGVTLRLGFNGTAQTGYDSNARMKFKFPDHSGFLCGTNGSEATAAVLVQRANKP